LGTRRRRDRRGRCRRGGGLRGWGRFRLCGTRWPPLGLGLAPLFGNVGLLGHTAPLLHFHVSALYEMVIAPAAERTLKKMSAADATIAGSLSPRSTGTGQSPQPLPQPFDKAAHPTPA